MLRSSSPRSSPATSPKLAIKFASGVGSGFAMCRPPFTRPDAPPASMIGSLRVFAIEIERCRRCGGRLKVIASIEEPALIQRILAHLEQRAEEEHTSSPFASRAPPQPSPL